MTSSHKKLDQQVIEISKSDAYIKWNNQGWIAIRDSKNPKPEAISGSSGGDEASFWKIHISIDPNKMDRAIHVICACLREQDAPRMAIKFANELLRFQGQPGKQVAFSIYEQDFNPERITPFLQKVADKLFAEGILPESRTLNSDYKPDKPKWDATIPYMDGSASYYGYRHDGTVVMDDALIDEDNIPKQTKVIRQEKGYVVRQSHFDSLPLYQRHNPANLPDPLAKIRLRNVRKKQEILSPVTQPSTDSITMFSPLLDSADNKLNKTEVKQKVITRKNAHWWQSGKSIDHWRKKWDSVQELSFPGNIENKDVGKALALLSEYSGFFKSLPIPCIKISYAWGGSIGRFFSGRWNTNHGDAVKEAIGYFYHASGIAWVPRYHAVDFILAVIKIKIGNDPIKQDGDLARILQVIKEKTNVDYFKLDENNVISRFGDEPRTLGLI